MSYTKRSAEAFGLTLTYGHANSDNWGRFGGGWNWALGFQIGAASIIINLLVFSIRIARRKS